MILSMEMLRQEIVNKHARARMIYSWYRVTYRKLRALGFTCIGRGKFVNSPFKIMISIMRCDAEWSTAFIHISGPEDAPKPLNVYEMESVKFLTLNQYGKLCKIPAKFWDRTRSNIGISKM
jgi:hypothetical protein